MSDTKAHTQALARFTLGMDAIQKQVAREISDLRFQIPEPEFQWSPEARAMRQGSTIGNVAVPAKPMLCIPKLDQPIQLVLNQEKAAHLGVQVHALSEDADDDTAEVMQGLYRRIEVDSRAGLARSWAYERAVKCGRGAYRILTEYADEGGHFTDQKIVIKRLLHQESAVLDPFAEEPDWSDGRWGFITSWMPWDRYTAKYHDSTLARTASADLDALQMEKPEWMTGEGEGRAVLVAEYFRLDYGTKTRVLLDDGSDAYDDAIPEGRSPMVGDEARSRREDVPALIWSLINAVEIIETEEMDGKYIPIIPVIGRELIPFDQERRWSGIISTNKDGQRLFNYAASQAVTVAALEPLAPFILDPRQIEGYEAQWSRANSSQQPYLPAVFDANKGWGAPARTQIDAGRLGPSMMLIQQADSFLHAGTGAFEAALGQGSAQNKTKGGILALQQQQEQGNSHFLDNLAEISLTYEAKVILDKMKYVYDRPGRVVRTLDLEDNTKTVMLNQPFVKGPTGRPMPAPPPLPPGMMPPQGPPPAGQSPAMGGQPPPAAPKVLHYDLKKGQYGVQVSIGKSYQNRAQQGKDELGQIFQAIPETFKLLGDLYFKFADFPGHREAAERMKKMLPPQLTDESDPQAAEQQLGQAKQKLSELEQAAQGMHQALQTKQVENAAKVQIAQGRDAMTLHKTQMDNETKLAVAELGAKVDRLSLFLAERARLGVQTHDEGLAGAQAAHELQLQQEGHAQQLAQGQQTAANQSALADQGQQHSLEQGQQAAALAPPPPEPVP